MSQPYRPLHLTCPVSSLVSSFFEELITPTKQIHFQHRNPTTFPIEALRMIVDAPWYVPNTVIRRDLQKPTVKEEIRLYSSQYSASLNAHPNGLVVNLMEQPHNKTPAK
jgi:hypothetical protein